MLSEETKSQFYNLLIKIADNERKVELGRQVLAEQTDFEVKLFELSILLTL